MRIHGVFYILAGVAISLYTRFIEARADTGSKLTLFFYVGLVFIGVGIFKLVARYVFKRGGGSDEESHPHDSEHEEHKKRSRGYQQSPKSKICPRCRSKMHPRVKYCSNCGFKFH